MCPDDPPRPCPAPGQAQPAITASGTGLARSLAVFVGLTGLTREDVVAGFRADPPRTLAQQAVAAGVHLDQLVAATVADTQRRLLDAVSAGRISPGRADERLADLEANVVELVTTIPLGGGAPPATVTVC